jgi:hypothetical protein
VLEILILFRSHRLFQLAILLLQAAVEVVKAEVELVDTAHLLLEKTLVELLLLNLNLLPILIPAIRLR